MKSQRGAGRGLGLGILAVAGVAAVRLATATPPHELPREPAAAIGGTTAVSSRRAEAAMAAGDWTAAAAALRELLHVRPRDVALNLDLVWTLERAGKDAEAAAFVQARPWLFRDPGIRAGATVGDAEPASLMSARAAARQRPGDAAAHAALAEALVAHARAQTTRLSFRCVVCHHREPPLYGPAVTRVLFPDRDTLLEAVAARKWAARLRRSPADERRIGEIYYYLATLYPPRHREAAGYLAQAHGALERAVQAGPRDAGGWSSLALARLKEGDATGAEAAWHRALALAPDLEEARVNLANLRHSRGHLADAVSLYAEGLRRLPKSAALRTNYGVLLWQQGLFQEAVAAQREALRLQPGDPVALLNLGLALKATGDLVGAEMALRESIRRRPGGAAAHNALGSLLAQRGDWAAATRAFAEATRRNPEMAAAHANTGRARERLEHWEEAAEAYELAIRWDPARSELWARVAEARDRAGDHRRAEEAARKFLASHPRDPSAETLRRRLAAWRRAHS